MLVVLGIETLGLQVTDNERLTSKGLVDFRNIIQWV